MTHVNRFPFLGTRLSPGKSAHSVGHHRLYLVADVNEKNNVFTSFDGSKHRERERNRGRGHCALSFTACVISRRDQSERGKPPPGGHQVEENVKQRARTLSERVA